MEILGVNLSHSAARDERDGAELMLGIGSLRDRPAPSPSLISDAKPLFICLEDFCPAHLGTTHSEWLA